ncbi:MAG: tetratricopeptide repeat protein [Planctomycetaceae bacterium]|nr:tetratricopeptide repeat protein [Planctomycetaceae bacterium]
MADYQDQIDGYRGTLEAGPEVSPSENPQVPAAPKPQKSESALYRISRTVILGCVLLRALGGGTSEHEQKIIDARASLDAGNLQAAQSQFEEIANDGATPSPWSSVARFELGRVAFRREDYPEAIRLTTQALQLSDLPEEEQLQARVIRGAAACESGDYTWAREDIPIVLAQNDLTDQFRARALLVRAMVRSQDGNFEAAIADETEAIKLASGDIDLITNLLYNRGVDYGSLNRLDEQLADYDAAIALNSSETSTRLLAYHNRSIVYARIGRIDDAIADAKTVLAMNNLTTADRNRAMQKLSDFMTTKSQAFVDAEDFAAAIEIETETIEAVSADPDLKSLHCYRRGSWAASADQPAKAIEDYDRVIQSGTSNRIILSWSHHDRSTLLQDEDEALKGYQAAIEVNPEDLELKLSCLTHCCSIHEDRGHFEKAIESAAAMTACEGMDATQTATSYYLRGYYALQLGQNDPGLSDLARARKLAVAENLTKIVESIDEIAPELPELPPESADGQIVAER